VYYGKKEMKLKRELGLLAAISMVVGNTIASTIFIIPQNLAACLNLKSTMLAWIITIIGTIFLALSFSNLATKFPTTRGCIIYTKKALAGFESSTIVA
jgi:amino acid transporter